jgi:hypothetical protein
MLIRFAERSYIWTQFPLVLTNQTTDFYAGSLILLISIQAGGVDFKLNISQIPVC